MTAEAGVPTRAAFLIPSVDGLRVAAFLVVFVNHAGWHPFEGRVALQMFFVLSGYLITTLMRREWDRTGRTDVRAFYLRRVLRILPPLYVVLLLVLLLTSTGVVPGRFTPGGFGATALHLVNYWIAYGHTGELARAVAPWWSLSVEEHFYLVFPVVFVVLFRARMSLRSKASVLAGIAVAILAYRSWLVFTLPKPEAWFRSYFPSEVAVDAILWGCVLALVANPVLDVVRGSRRFWLYGALPLSLVVIWLAQAGPREWTQSVGYTVQSLAVMVLIVAVVQVRDTWLGRVLNWRPVVFVSTLSYSMYLLHFLMIELGREYVPGPRAVGVAVALAATVVGGWVVYLVVEKPCARLRRRLSRAGEVQTVADRTAAAT